MKRLLSLCFLLPLLVGCNSGPKVTLLPDSQFDTIIDGKKVALYTLKNTKGMAMQVTNYGARVVSLWAPDRAGKMSDVVLGYKDIHSYVNNPGERFLGAAIGRYGNRIANGKFTLDGKEYQLAAYNNGQCLHGGLKSFDRVVWNVDSVMPNKICFSYLSPDGEENFPGNLNVKMTYELTDNDDFEINYTATTDKATPVNLTNHTFFNLKGEGNGDILAHELTIRASHFTPVDSLLIPTGELKETLGTPFDFQKPRQIGSRIDMDDPQLRNGQGYDHNWVLDRHTDKNLEWAATVFEPVTGRQLEVWTTEPGLQFYSGNFFDGAATGKSGQPYDYRCGIALETQHFPDSPNHPDFPNTILKPGETYQQTCVYKFRIK